MSESQKKILKLVDDVKSVVPSTSVLSSDVVRRLKNGQAVDDDEFDAIFPLKIQALSIMQWSPVEVAIHVADFLRDTISARFLDVGSGPGKLCTLLSLMTNLEVYGVEQRWALYRVATSVAKRNQIKNVHYINGNMMDLDWDQYDIFYLYNPFQEHICDTDFGIIDKNIELDKKFYNQYIEEVFSQLQRLKPGKKVITYQGYGGLLPPSMRLTRSRMIGSGQLRMWQKMSDEELKASESKLEKAWVKPLH